MSVSLEGDVCVFVTQNLGERFHIHAYFQRPGGKGMPERVKALVFYSESSQQPLEAPLIRPHRHGASSVGYNELSNSAPPHFI